VKYGIPYYFFLEPNKPQCLVGVIDDESEEFIMSYDNASIETVKGMNINCKVNDQKVVYKTTYAMSEMTLEINDLKLKEPATFEICLASN
jgi:hypothetical protein